MASSSDLFVTSLCLRWIVVGLEACGMPPERLTRWRELVDGTDRWQRLPYGVTEELWAEARAWRGERHALDVGARVPRAARYLTTLLFETAVDLAASLRDLCDMTLSVTSSVRIDLCDLRDGRHVLVIAPASREVSLESPEFSLGGCVSYLHAVAGRDVVRQVWSPRPTLEPRPRWSAGAELLAAAPVTAVVVDDCALALAPPSIDPMVNLWARALVPPRLPTGAVASAIRFVAEHLGDGEVDLVSYARSQSYSPRQVQRHLGGEGASYDGIVDLVRRSRALAMAAAGGDRSTMAVALGYDGPRSFARAFERWTGTSPTAYRRAREHGGRAAIGSS